MPADVVMPPDPSQGTPPAPDPSQYSMPDPAQPPPAPTPPPLQVNSTEQPQESAQRTDQVQPTQAPNTGLHSAYPVHPFRDRIIQSARDVSAALMPTPYKTTIDADGNTVRTPQPLHARAFGIALAMEALQGGLAGAGERGTNATGQAAVAGMAQGEKIAAARQAAQAASDEQAQTDLKTKQQVTINGMQTRLLAQTIGRGNMEDAQQQVKMDSADWSEHQEDPQSIKGQGLDKSDALAMYNKLGPGNAQILITGTKPRLDADGNEVWQKDGKVVPEGTPGAYKAPDLVYAVVTPTAKVTAVDNDGKLLPDYARPVAQGFASIATGSDGKLPAGYKIDGKSAQAAKRSSQTAVAMQADANRVRAAEGLAPLSDADFDKDLASGSDVRNGQNIYNSVLAAGHTHQQAMDAVAASPYKSAAGVINSWYGGKDKTDQYDAHAADLDYDNSVLHGKPIVTRDDAQRAVASSNPQVVAKGKAAQKAMDVEDARQAGIKQAAVSGAEVAAQERLAKFKSDLTGAGGADNPYFNETPNPQTGIRDNYVASLKDGDLVRNIIAGDKEPPNLRTKEGRALAAEVSQATGGHYDDTRYAAYKRLRTDMSPGGKVGQSLTAANTAMDHLAAATDHATRVSTLPIVGALGGKGVFGKANQDAYNAFVLDRSVAASELGKAVEGKVLTQGEADEWHQKLMSWTPTEFRSKAVPLANLLRQRMHETQARAVEGSPAGSVTGLHVATQSGIDSYNRITGGNDTLDQYTANNTSPRYTQQSQDIPQAPPKLANFQTNGQVRIGQAPDGTWYDTKTMQPYKP